MVERAYVYMHVHFLHVGRHWVGIPLDYWIVVTCVLVLLIQMVRYEEKATCFFFSCIQSQHIN